MRLPIIGTRERGETETDGGSWLQSRGRTRAVSDTSGMWRASASRPTPSPAITDCAETTSSWSAGRTSTARPSWSRPTRRASRRVKRRTVSTRSFGRTSSRSGSRTTSSRGRHEESLSRHAGSFRTLYEKGFVLERETLGAFSASTGHTLPDRYIEGTCPICGFHDARGDQCDNCGNQLDPIDLIDPRQD